MAFLVQRLSRTLQPGQRLGVVGSDAALHSRQGARDGSCALHYAAMALATLGLLGEPFRLRGVHGPRVAEHARRNAQRAEWTSGELRKNLRTAVAEGLQETATRFCKRELSQA